MSGIIGSLIFTSLLVGQSAGDETQNLQSMGRYIQPCKSWTYSSAVSGYVCRFYDSFDAATQSDLQRLEGDVIRLERRVDDLERRVSELENKP